MIASGPRARSRRASAVALLVAAGLGIAACGGGGDEPFARGGEPAAPAAATTAAPPATTAVSPATSPAPSTPGTTAPGPAVDDAVPTQPAQAPSPAGSTPDPLTTRGERPKDRQGRIAADATAMLAVRTMVSIVEGCHSGRQSYKDCNTHEELGSSELLGLEIGKRRGQVQISATDNGFRITAHSMSGAKFTVARGPKGDRFKCLTGPEPGACPADRAWSF